jgi:hypothetical protein
MKGKSHQAHQLLKQRHGKAFFITITEGAQQFCPVPRTGLGRV